MSKSRSSKSKHGGDVCKNKNKQWSAENIGKRRRHLLINTVVSRKSL